jgi:hypothetical protein
MKNSAHEEPLIKDSARLSAKKPFLLSAPKALEIPLVTIVPLYVGSTVVVGCNLF